MDFSSVFAKVVALIGGAALVVRKIQGVPQVTAWGQAPAIPEAKPQSPAPFNSKDPPAQKSSPTLTSCAWTCSEIA